MYREIDNQLKVHEFVAHSTEVNCLSFGPKSQQVLATGGNDSKVNIWKVGNASNIWALGQNKSPVECLCFDAEEQYIVSGASNGSIKVFDLNEGRLARNLSGHQVNTSSIQYHPYGEFIVSGSVDCSMKVWDVRNKSCIQTYSGHKKEVTCVRFSPDGRWIASSGKDNQLLIWDLVAGKLLNTIRTDPAYVTSFEFNPAEFVIAAVTSNRNVRLWDMESMEPLNNTPSESNPIRTMAFSGDGNTIYTATKDSLKSYAWETTVKMKGMLEIGWDKIAELRVSADGNTLTAGSFNSNFVSIWSVDLNKVNNSTNTGSDGKYISQQRAIKSKAVPGNRSDKFTKDSVRRNSSNIDVDYEADSKTLEGLSLDPSTAAKTEENSPEMHWESEEARNVMESSMSASLQKKLQEHRRQSSERSNAEQSQVDDKENTPSSIDAIQNLLPPSRYIIDSPSSSSATDRDRRTGSPLDQRNNGSRGRVTTGVRGHTPLKGPSRSAASDRDQSDYMSYADINGDHHSPLKIKGLSSRNASERSLAEAKINREDPTLRAAAKRAAAAAGSSNMDQSNRDNRNLKDDTTEGLLDRVVKNSSSSAASMSQRLTSIRILKRLWMKGDLQDVIEYVDTISKGTVHDPSQLILLADLFLSVELKGSNFTLDFCVGFMVVLESMISINERLNVNVIVLAVLKGFTELCDGFGELIRSSRAMKMSGGGGVDLSREERLRKCNVCHAVVDRLKGKLDRIRHIHRTDTKLLRIIDRLTPLIVLIVPF